MSAGCGFITCAVKRRGIESCCECGERGSCERWARHRAAGREHDSFVSYAALEDNIALIEAEGIAAFDAHQQVREGLLREMLDGFDEGRSKTYYSVAVTLLDVDEVRSALGTARSAAGPDAGVQVLAAALHAALDARAAVRGVRIGLRT